MMKLFLSDLDGTLIDVHGNIQQQDVQAIHTLAERGIAFGIVTGRDYGFCQKLISRYRLAADMIIGNNGGSIWIHDEKVMEEHIEAGDAVRIMEFLKDHVDEINPFVCNEQSTFFFMREQYAPEHWNEVREQLAYLGDIADRDLLRYLKEKQEPVVKISIHTYTQERRDTWLPILHRQFQDAYEILPTSFDYIEITRKGIDKGKSFLQALEYWKLSQEEVAFIGDGANDIPLFHEVEASFCMASAAQEVRREAAHVVKSVAEAVTFVIE